MTDPEGPEEFVTYPAGLRLAGRRVVVVGGGHVAQRRVPSLLSVGADVLLVSPEVTPSLEGLAGELTWLRRGYAEGDLAGAWYAIAATDDREVNQAVSAEAEAARIFCVRADDATEATAFTPATGRHDTVTVAVLGNHMDDRDPRRSAAVRDELLAALSDGVVKVRGPQTAAGSVVLVGGGPGDPDLVTVAGRRALMSADVVVADRLAPRELLGDLAADVEVIDVAKLPRGRSTTQEEINRVIVERAQAGHRVVRFKGGDSFVFGRGYEEVIACREAGVPVTVIPGLSSPVTVPGLAGIPVTHRGVTHEFTVVSGHVPPGHPDSLTEWDALGRMRGTVVLMMAVENAPAIAAALVAGGRSGTTPVAVVCDGSMKTQRTVLSTLGELEADLVLHDVRPPAIIVVGEVVAVAHPERYAATPVPDAEPVLPGEVMRVAVLGTGIMGAAMARSLACAELEVVVWNRTRSRADEVAGSAVAISVADTVTEAVTGADVVLSILFDTDAVLAVTDELARSLAPDAVWVQASTVGPDGVRRIAAAAGAAGERLLDAPVLGTRKPAEDGTLVVLASGPRALREQAGPVLDAIGGRTVVAGDEVGAASGLKLACNSWVGLVTAGTAQALGLAAVQGLDPALFLEAISGGAVDTPYAHLKGAAMLDGSYDEVSFTVDGVRKDSALMVEAAAAAGMRTDLLQAVLALYDDASARGHGSDDLAAVTTAFRGDLED